MRVIGWSDRDAIARAFTRSQSLALLAVLLCPATREVAAREAASIEVVKTSFRVTMADGCVFDLTDSHRRHIRRSDEADRMIAPKRLRPCSGTDLKTRLERAVRIPPS
jgi:hypothetical protein